LTFCGLLVAIFLLLSAAPAQAAIGYEPDAVKPQINIVAQLPHGIAIDQTSQQIYVAVFLKAVTANGNGEVLQLQPDGTPTANSPFTAGSSAFFASVAVNPLTHDVFASRSIAETPQGNAGEAKMHQFSATGGLLGSFALNISTASGPQIAIDSSGRIYYPNPATDAVEVLNSSGVLQSTISCADCPGGTFAAPVSVAIDPADNVYVVDLEKDSVVKLKPAAQLFAFERQFQSGRGAGAVAVDPVSGDVFVGDLPGGTGYHIVAYDSSGVQFDDFAAGMVSNPPPEAGRRLTAQIAINATTRDLYIADQNRLLVFERGTIDPPTVTSIAASSVGQLKGTLNATVNAHGHAVLECEFEYTNHADFLANEFTNATSIPCPNKPNTLSPAQLSTVVSGLIPSTTYHYRVVATSNAGSTSGNDQTFATLAALPPAVTAQPATGISQTGATLAGKVNPNGGSVSDCHFEYGTTTSYGTEIPCAALPGHVSTEVPQSRSASGLSPGTTYHYRLAVTSNAGTSKGSDVAFTTASPPAPPTPPPSDPDPPPASPTPPAATTPSVSTVAPTVRKPLRCRKGFKKKRIKRKLRCVKKPKKRRTARKRPQYR